MQANTPIIVGAGQCVSHERTDPTQMPSPVDLAAEAARRALADSGAGTGLAGRIDSLTVIRLFEHSVRGEALWPNPFGCSDNVPWSVANRLGIEPTHAVYSEVGGHSPQRLVNRACEAIHAGSRSAVLLTGAEAVAAIRDARRGRLALDWHEHAEGAFEDAWSDYEMATAHELRHGITLPIQVYALFEQARRRELGLSTEDFRRWLGTILAPFSAVAAQNPMAQFPTERSADWLATPSADNYLVCEPYTKWMVAQDAVNLGAAVVLTSAGVARDLGIAPSRWVYLRGYGDADDGTVLTRPRLAASQAQAQAVEMALASAEVTLDAIAHVDLYSCFPIAVSSACEVLDLDPIGPRALTLTGGLPFLGGPGNNYSMHAIAEVVPRLRAERDANALIVANGGYLSKHSVGVYAGSPPAQWGERWRPASPSRPSDATTVRVTEVAAGPGTVESYAAIYRRGVPADGIVVGRLADDTRFIARPAPATPAALAALFEDDVIGRRVHVTHADDVNYFSFDNG